VHLVSCLPVDWPEVIAALGAAAAAVIATLAAKHRPPDRRTRRSDQLRAADRRAEQEDPDEELADVPFDWPFPHGATPGHGDRPWEHLDDDPDAR
jgi:hypothetical protein